MRVRPTHKIEGALTDKLNANYFRGVISNKAETLKQTGHLTRGIPSDILAHPGCVQWKLLPTINKIHIQLKTRDNSQSWRWHHWFPEALRIERNMGGTTRAQWHLCLLTINFKLQFSRELETREDNHEYLFQTLFIIHTILVDCLCGCDRWQPSNDEICNRT